MSERDEKPDYTVGYGKPPAEHRFKKGQSGNPKGRPRKPAKKPEPQRFRDGHLDHTFEQEAFRLVQLNENGRPTEMTAAQAVFRSVLVEGIKGNRLAKKYVFEKLRQEEQDALKRSLEQYKHFKRKKKEGEAKIARCEKQGIRPPRLLPHPDDILLDEAKLEVHVLGPLTEDQAIPFERGALARDCFYVCSVLEEKRGKVTPIEHEGKSASACEVFAALINKGLPPSFQRSDASAAAFLVALGWLTERQLRQEMRALMAQIANMPRSVEERLAAQAQGKIALGAIGDGLEKLAADLAEKQKPDN